MTSYGQIREDQATGNIPEEPQLPNTTAPNLTTPENNASAQETTARSHLLLILSIILFVFLAVRAYPSFKNALLESQSDLRVFLACAHDLRAERPIYADWNRNIAEDPSMPESVGPYIYPPLLGIIMIPFSLIPFEHFKHFWCLLNLFMLAHALWMLAASLPERKYRLPAILVVGGIMLGSKPLIWLLQYGQSDMLVYYLCIAAFRLFQKERPTTSAFLVCTAAWIKVTPALLVLFLITRGNKRYFISAIIATFSLGLVQFLVAGKELWFFFDRILPFITSWTWPSAPNAQSIVNMTEFYLPQLSSLTRPKTIHALSIALRAAVATGTILILLRRSKIPQTQLTGFAACVCAMPLLPAHAWQWSFIGLCVPLMALLGTCKKRRYIDWLSIVFVTGIFLLFERKIIQEAAGPLEGWRSIFTLSSGLTAFTAFLYLAFIFLQESRWTWTKDKA